MKQPIRVDKEVYLFTRDMMAGQDHKGRFLVSLRSNSWKLKIWWAENRSLRGRDSFVRCADGLLCNDEIEADMLLRSIQEHINEEVT